MLLCWLAGDKAVRMVPGSVGPAVGLEVRLRPTHAPALPGTIPTCLLLTDSAGLPPMVVSSFSQNAAGGVCITVLLLAWYLVWCPVCCVLADPSSSEGLGTPALHLSLA